MEFKRLPLLLVLSILGRAAACGKSTRRLGVGKDGCHHWGYTHDDLSVCTPESWSTMSGNEACISTGAQSPVNIDAVTINSDLPTLKFDYQDLYSPMLENNGHSAEIDGASGGSIDVGSLPEMHFGNNGSSTYELLQIHFHWGRNHTARGGGSEHTINGRHAQLEMHMVHTQVGNSNPTQTPGGLAVIGVLFEEGDSTNPALSHVTDHLHIIAAGNASTSSLSTSITNNISVNALLPEATESNYMTYRGSLTTPGCYESVVWIISGKRNYISKEQMANFRHMTGSFGSPIAPNFRPVQPLNGREVYATRQPSLLK